MNHTFLLLLFLLLSATTYGNNLNKKINEIYFHQIADDPDKPIEQRISFCDSLINTVSNDNKSNIYLKKGVLQYSSSKFSEAVKTLQLALKTCPRNNLPLKCEILYNKAKSMFMARNLTESFNICFDILDMDKPDSLKYYDVKGNILLANMFKSMNAIDQEEKQLKEAYNSYLQIKKSSIGNPELDDLRKHIYAGFSTVSLSRGKYEESLNWIRKAITLTSDSIDKASLNVNLAYIYQQTGNYKMAEKLYQELIDMNVPHINLWMAIAHLAQMRESNGYHKEALDLIQSHRDKWYLISNSLLETYILYIMSQAYENLGDYRRAIDLTRRSLNLRDSIAYIQQADYYKMLLDKFEHRTDTKNRHKLKVQNKNMRNGLWIASILILLLSAFLVVTLMKWKEREKKVSELKSLMNKSESKYTEQINKKDEYIHECNRELASKNLQLAQMNEAINQFESISKDKEMKSDILSAEISKLHKDLKLNKNIWKPFLMQFEKIHPSFFTNLNELCSSLTPAEKRMCAFLLMNMTTKEIASATNRSTRTVDCIKYNLRQKLGITGSSESFMQSVAKADSEELEKLKKSVEPDF